MRTRLPELLLGLLVVLATAALVWPGPSLFMASAEPVVLGLPWPIVYTMGWLVAVFAGLAVYDAHRGGR